jgi:DnaJ-class molecular chaperone
MPTEPKVLMYFPCDACEGSGQVPLPKGHRLAATGETTHPCPTCGGSGDERKRVPISQAAKLFATALSRS